MRLGEGARPVRPLRRAAHGFPLAGAARARQDGERRPAGDPLEIKRPGWIATDDYPVAAFSNGIEGEVGYDVDVSPTGKPLRCRIRRSSRSDLLDRVTCTLVMARLIFIPAVDAQGHWREGVDHGSTTWRTR